MSGCARDDRVLSGLSARAVVAKTIQYPEDHERYLRIDKAVESLREAYVRKDVSGMAALMVPTEATDRLQQEAESDFEIVSRHRHGFSRRAHHDRQ